MRVNWSRRSACLGDRLGIETHELFRGCLRQHVDGLIETVHQLDRFRCERRRTGVPKLNGYRVRTNC